MTFRKTYSFFLAIGIIVLLYACANRGQGPTGGPKDVTPPRVMHSNPPNGTLNFKKKQVLIDFDEMVSVQKASDNIIISPPQIKPPDVKSYGKRIAVNFNEDLADSTTYSIDFGDAIVDLNEGNPIKDYLFSFSTGNIIDTLRISGTVIDASNLNPMKGILVGVYIEDADSVFLKKPFLRVGKTDENGHFTINNLKKGNYRIFGLGDTNHDYYYQPGEGIALSDSMITPTCKRELMHDSIWKDSTHFDSVRTYMGTRFLPDDITLRFFKENKKPQRFVKYERKNPFSFTLFFNTEAKELPTIEPLNFNWEGKYLLQKNNTMDTLTYWLTDQTIWEVDTLRMKLMYQKTDSLMQLVPASDTISVILRKAKVNLKAKAPKGKVKAEPFLFNTNLSPTFEVYNPILLNFRAPLEAADLSKITLSEQVDTIFKEIPLHWRQTDSTKTTFAIDYKWVPETTYNLDIDSAAFLSIYKKASNPFVNNFKIRSLDEYSGIKILLAPYNAKAVLQVLDTKDNVQATKPALEKGTLFNYLKPGDYYVRMFIDENGNGKWDPGSLANHKQPEEVYYYNKKFTLKANWEFEEIWNYQEVPLLKQKPLELIKNETSKAGNND